MEGGTLVSIFIYIHTSKHAYQSYDASDALLYIYICIERETSAFLDYSKTCESGRVCKPFLSARFTTRAQCSPVPPPVSTSGGC
jgi:hypothetical protein